MMISHEDTKTQRQSVFSCGGAEDAEVSRPAAPAAVFFLQAGNEGALSRALAQRPLRLCANPIFAPSRLGVNQFSAPRRLRVNQLQANH